MAYANTGVAKTLLGLFEHVGKHNVRLIWFRNPYKLPIRWMALFIMAIIHRPDYIHFHWGNIPPLLPCKKVLMLHDIIPILMGKKMPHVLKDIERADIIFTCSEYSKNTIKQHLGVNAIVIRHGV